ncbi:hypothetical protein KIW84_071676 [Lathyrus oleraceus]|uniref:DUF7745 domain-containing protein n=1 Tax=Pisum sativum TaxID=3888 RepID=A0A9D4ZU17_PEA|nr:hypothetical protein KIW84_071676 [Pisum sativum]
MLSPAWVFGMRANSLITVLLSSLMLIGMKNFPVSRPKWRSGRFSDFQIEEVSDDQVEVLMAFRPVFRCSDRGGIQTEVAFRPIFQFSDRRSFRRSGRSTYGIQASFPVFRPRRYPDRNGVQASFRFSGRRSFRQLDRCSLWHSGPSPGIQTEVVLRPKWCSDQSGVQANFPTDFFFKIVASPILTGIVNYFPSECKLFVCSWYSIPLHPDHLKVEAIHIDRSLGIAYCISCGYIVQVILLSLGQKIRGTFSRLQFFKNLLAAAWLYKLVEARVQLPGSVSPLGFWLDFLSLSGELHRPDPRSRRGSSSRLPINLLVVVCLEADVSPSSGIRVPVCVCLVRMPIAWIPSSTTDVRGANTFPLRNRLPYPFSLVARPCFFQIPWSSKLAIGKLLSILSTEVDEGLMSVLVQFYDPLYCCFTFPDFQLLPTLEEYAYLVGIPILDQLSFSGLERVPSSQEIADLLHMDVSDIGAHMTTKGGIQGLPSGFLIAQATLFGKALSEETFEAIFVLLIYGLVLFPNIDNFVDVNAIMIFSTLNPVPALLGDTYFSLHMRNVKGGGTIVCCLSLLHKWFISHLPQTLAFKENKGCLRWSTRLMSLTNDDIFWYNRVYDGVQIIDSCGEFSNVPLLGTCCGINYNPILARRQLGFPLKDKPNNILLEGIFFQEGKDPQNLKGRMVCAWRKIHRKGRKELGPRNCIALEPYTSWVRKRASEYRMPYDYPRPTPMVMVGPSTLLNQGVEKLRDEDRSRAWIFDEPDDVVTSLLPQSSKFWKRKYDRLAKEKADMEAAYEREVKRLRAAYLPISRALDDCF